MNNEWGLTEKGFRRPSFPELLDAYEIKAKELFGAEINLSVRSPLGIFLRVFAWFSGLAWQLAEDVYNSSFVDTAVGVSLSRMGADVIYNKLVCPVNEVPGVADYTLEVSADGETWVKENIPVGPREKAALIPERVVIE